MKEPTIQTTLLGRLGNQLFVYAATRIMALESGCKLLLTEECLRKKGLTNRLDCFNIPQNVVSIDRNKKFSFFQRIGYLIYMLMCRKHTIEQVYKIEKKHQKFFHRFGLVFNQEGYIKPLPLEKRNWYALGYFQCDQYFSKYENLLRKELSFRTEMFSDSAICLGTEIKTNPNSVCLHIRRGDYLNDPVFAVCKADYYHKALKILLEQLPNAEFYVFSDNIDEVKGQFAKYRNNFNYIDAKYTDQESLFLGSCCKHFIMSNSTFSWWMQYLSDNKDKIVLAPNRWYNTNNPCDIYQDNWQLIEV